jgi:hypothetical protein
MNAFVESSVTTITIPSSVETLADGCFLSAKRLSEIRFEPNCRLTGIESALFMNCNLESIIIPATVTKITAMSGLSRLRSIYLESGSRFELRQQLLCDPARSQIVSGFGDDHEVVIPSWVEAINFGAFHRRAGLQKVVFERGARIVTVAKHAFSHCLALRRVRIPASIRSLGMSCFWYCPRLEVVEFDENSQLKIIGSGVFSTCGIVKFRVPRSVEVLGQECFAYCTRLGEVAFEEGSELKRIEAQAFYESSLARIDIPQHVEVVGQSAFPRHCQIALAWSENSKEFAMWKREHRESFDHLFPDRVQKRSSCTVE